ncbi:MFS transporter [Ketobacter sp. MCCC 1A13808]|uniref:MFS transporter n=1 Tax=Ketobacter sp. MCCC 1A13808 TaxID=2602738 RepID=UPI0012EC813C|nr:MFS transporter [Ketobacter sp. MCCC 1A13808]MVF11061.1 MFS transporter [Ketobacter sp. MCCC 1A13808]
MNEPERQEHSQFSLLKSKRFAPFFWTQFFGAFNDNVFKNALMALITFGILSSGMELNQMNNLGAMLFILPFFLFSALAGQLADKYEKAKLIRYVKLFEIFIMVVGGLCFWFQQTWGLMLLLFLMGTQSAFFGPVKYSIIPQHLKPDELVGGNALVETGTFLAILLGTISAGVISDLENATRILPFVVVILSVIGYLVCLKIPLAPAPSPDIRVRFNPFTETWKTVQFSRQNKPVFLAIMAISWFWFLGAAYLTQIYGFAKIDLQGDQSVVMSLLAIFSIGIAVGSLLCERLSGHKVELGLVPLGSIGLSLAGLDLYFQTPPAQAAELIGLATFLSQSNSYRVLLDFMLIGIFGGLYIVPLYAMVQQRSEEASRSRIIASINIMNALFMVVSAITGILVLGVMDLSIPQFFLILAIMNAVVACYIYSVIPEFFMRFLIWVITHTMYRVTHTNLDKIPESGPVLLVCNHVSYMDALIIGGACRRPVRFVMFKPIYDLPVLNFIFRTGKTIPIHSRKSDPETYESAFKRISEELRDDEVVCIFPEGKLTQTGGIDEFKNGVEKILQQDPVPIVPMALKGLWGSFFSHKDSKALTRLPRRFWSKVELVAGDPIAPENTDARQLQSAVEQLRGNVP